MDESNLVSPAVCVHDFAHHRHSVNDMFVSNLCTYDITSCRRTWLRAPPPSYTHCHPVYVRIDWFICLFIQPVTTHEQRCWCRCVFTFRVNLHKDVVWWLSAPPPSCCHPLMYISIEWFSYVLVHISILCVCVSSLSFSLSLSFFRHTGLNPSPWTAIVYTFVIPCMYLFVHLGIPNVCVIFSLALAFLWCKCLFAGCRCVRVRRGEGGHL